MGRQLAAQKEELTGFIVHDLKNPLASILANTRFLHHESAADDDAKDAAKDVLDAAESMHRMVLDLLDVSRAENGALVAKLVEVDVPKLLDNVSRAVGLRAAEKETKLVVRATALGGRLVRADKDLLSRVLENLLDNCLKYTPSGSTIQIEAEVRSDTHVELAIRDDGPGIPPEFRDKVFEKYVRLEGDGHSSQARNSRGLGLVFCRLAVEAHGGRIWVEENQPRGSCFRIRLPQASLA